MHETESWDPMTEYNGHIVAQRVRFTLDRPNKVPPELESIKHFDTYRCLKCDTQTDTPEEFCDGTIGQCTAETSISTVAE